MAKLELLSPAGDMERLKMSVLYGADAVYLAGTDFGMRSFAENFTPEELPKAVEFAHSHGVKVHVTVNTMPRNEEIAALPPYLEQLQDAGVDALIVADMGCVGLGLVSSAGLRSGSVCAGAVGFTGSVVAGFVAASTLLSDPFWSRVSSVGSSPVGAVGSASASVCKTDSVGSGSVSISVASGSVWWVGIVVPSSGAASPL